MNIFENIRCPLCQADNFTELYISEQYGDAPLGKMHITIGMCNECTFIYQNPQLTEEALKIHYQENSSGDIYRETGKGSAYWNLIEERKEFLQEILSEDIKVIADIGGGSGLFLSALKTQAKKYLIEPSNALQKNTDKNIIKIQRNAEELTEETLRFDLLTSIMVLEHVKNPAQIVKIFHKLLTDEGYLFIEVPNSLQPEENFAEYFSYEHVNHFTYETLNELLSKNLFYPVKIAANTSKGVIRVLSKKKKTNSTRENLLSFFTSYRERKELFAKKIAQKISLIINDENIKSLSIYGTGDHTKFIIERFAFLLNKVDFFIDSDPKKWGRNLYGKKILSPKEIKEKNLLNILVSSQKFELEICKTIEMISKEVTIITLYQ